MLTYRVETLPAGAPDVKTLVGRGLREADRRELLRLSGLPFERDTILQSVFSSRDVTGIFVDDEIAALYGVAPLQEEKSRCVGMPWLVAHDDFERKETAVPMMRISRRGIEKWLGEFDLLMNLVDPEHLKAVAYLKRLGFTLEFDAPVAGPLGDRLIPFWRTRHGWR